MPDAAWAGERGEEMLVLEVSSHDRPGHEEVTASMIGHHPVRVGIESTDRRSYASALDWPGWSRPGRTPEAALAALAAAHPRYAAVLRSAHMEPPEDGPYEVVERRVGDGSTAFGIPAAVFDADREAPDAAQAARLAAIVAAAFAAFDAVVAAAPPVLRKGPRGGGRDRDEVVAHVAGGNEAYARPAGARLERGATDADRRAALIACLARPDADRPSQTARWPSRHAARRIAWHALDHAWEIEDRTET